MDTVRYDTEYTLNEIVALNPQTLPVLSRNGLDTCCGGALKLREAAERHGLDLEKLMTELQEVEESN